LSQPRLRLIQLDETTGELVLQFRYQPQLIERVRSLPGARWHALARHWRLPMTSVEAACTLLQDDGFVWDDDVAALLHRASSNAQAPVEAGDEGSTDASAGGLTVGRLRMQIEAALRQHFPHPVWVQGVLTDVRPPAGRSYLYARLRDPDGPRPTTAASASMQLRVTGAAFTLWNREIKAAGLTPEEGLPLRVLVRVSLDRRGQVTLDLERLDIRYSLGEFILRREEVLRVLRGDPAWGQNLQRPVPGVPLRLAVLTSRDGDALRDVVQTLAASELPFRVWLLDVRVQGDHLRPTVLRALERVAEARDRVDMMLVVRGGGSRQELAGWDDLEVARALLSHPVPALIGIGHERDRSVLDDIARSALTPTAAARWVVDHVRVSVQQAERAFGRVAGLASRRLERSEATLRRSGERLARAATLRTRELRRWLDGVLPERLRQRVMLRMQRERGRLVPLDRALRVRRATELLGRAESRIDALQQRLQRAPRVPLDRALARLDAHERVLAARDPRAVLARGYALIRDPEGRLCTTLAALPPGGALTIEMQDGTAPARLEPPPLVLTPSPPRTRR
jgi:exodeoxyribonuclease VII large subunit